MSPAITIYDSLHHNSEYAWPTDPLQEELGHLLNVLQDHSDYQIADWTTGTTQPPDWTTIDLNFAPAPRQQEGYATF